MTLREATSALYDHFGLPRYPHYIQSIGEAETTQTIHVMLVRKPYHFEKQIPDSWHGFPVKKMVIGEIRIGPP